MAESGLVIENVRAGYGSTIVLEDVTLAVGSGTAISILGRNGVGKTTLLATLMGLATLHAGTVSVGGINVSGMKPGERAAHGLGFVPQQREIFASLTVEENLRIGKRPGQWTLEAIYGLFPGLKDRRSNMGNQLSGGEQQMLAVGRALMTNPSILLLDEPFEGLAPIIVDQLFAALAALRDSGAMSILLVEQHTRHALAFAPRAIVINRGRIVFDGASAALKADPSRLASLCAMD